MTLTITYQIIYYIKADATVYFFCPTNRFQKREGEFKYVITNRLISTHALGGVSGVASFITTDEYLK